MMDKTSRAAAPLRAVVRILPTTNTITSLNAVKCGHSLRLVNAITAFRPTISPLGLRTALSAIIALTCPALSETGHLSHLRELFDMARAAEADGAAFSSVPGISQGRPAAVLFPTCSAPLRLNGSVVRVNAALAAHREDKVACGQAETVFRRPCLVVSIGSNGEAGFEESVHATAPHCEVHTWDGTLNKRKIAMLPSFVSLMRRNFRNDSWTKYAHRNVSIAVLKMDCEGCEFGALPPLVDSICVEQILMEVHGATTLSSAFAAMFARLALTHDPFYGEYNPGCLPHVRCFEIAWRRRTPCLDRLRRDT